MKKIVFASNNEHKIIEVKEILNDIVSKLDDSQINQNYKDEINDIFTSYGSSGYNAACRLQRRQQYA